MGIYVADTNFFIEAHRKLYPLDVAISFWKKIKQFSDEEKLISIDKVRKEIFINDDELTTWIENNLPKNFFKKFSVFNNYKKVIQWAVNSNQYNDKAKQDFAMVNNADAFLIAFCLQNSSKYILLTQETSAPNSIKTIKIPDVCKIFNITCRNTIEMFRDLKATF